ncbi:hypothetical protein [Paraburkholderia sp. BCC1886]|uniref:hypothetical protein n=1 Tax=Paraburkholderia sp. BCC1886 TaxID=2562670 RepID=UPI001183F43A|nr:hypothetical protein [Paraburkholderia sp. BCC1886]
MEQLTFWACVKNAWSSAWQAVTTMPWLVLGSWIVLTCTSLLGHPAVDAETGAQAHAGQALMSLVWLILHAVVSAMLSVKVHRFILLGEATNPLVPSGGRPLFRFLVVSFGAALGLLVFFGLGQIAAHTFKLGVFILLPLQLIYLFVLIRLSLLYPSVALGAQLTLGSAWRDSRGHFWRFFGVGFCSCLPLFLLTGVGIWLAARSNTLLLQQGTGNVVVAMSWALLQTLLSLLTAASLAWLYRRCANELLTHVPGTPQ